MAEPPESPDPKPPEPAATVESVGLDDTLPSLGKRSLVGEAGLLVVGERLGDRYLVRKLLGRGGMGAVYLAADVVLGKEVALKHVFREAAGGTGGIEKLRDEVLLAQKVTHPNICRTYDLEEVDGHALIKMEYVAGETLAARITREDRLPVDDALGIARSITSGLIAAHAERVIHRDLKPQNVVIEERTGRVVLMDFGIAHVAKSTDASDESEDNRRTVGTPEYMAPEQARGGAIDGRTDLYALGCVLYQMVIGDVPYPASTPMGSVVRHLTEPVPDPRSQRADLPPWLSKLIERLMAKDPSLRPASAVEVLRLLEGPAPSRVRRVAPVLTVAAAALAAGAVALYRWQMVSALDCQSVVLRRQVMECEGPLDADALAGRSITWRVRRQRGRVQGVERMRDGHRAADDDGVAAWDYAWDDAGHLKETVERDELGAFRARFVHDADLGRSDRRDSFSEPLAEPGTDITVEMTAWDERGFLRQVRYANVYGSARPDERGAFGYQVQTDDRGRTTKLVALDEKGAPLPTTTGLAAIEFVRDAAGNAVEERVLGVDGKPIRSPDGWAVLRRKFDERGNATDEAFFGVDGKPTFSSNGYASSRAAYDRSGERVQVSFFGADGGPVLAKGGQATVRVKFDPRGRPIEESYFGVYGEAALGHDGYSVRRTKYEASAVEESYFDTKNRAVTTPGGWAKLREERDAAGAISLLSYYDVDGRPTLTREGIASVRRQRDERGRVISEICLGVDSRPTIHRDGFSTRRFTRDERGREIEEALLGADGKPARHRDGWSRTRMKYDELGNRIEVAFLDGEGHPVMRMGGYSIVRRGWDRRGRLVEESYFDRAGARVIGSEGWSKRTFAWDEGKLVAEEKLFDASDRPVVGAAGFAERRSTHDERGLETEMSRFGSDGKSILGRDGFAIRKSSYDALGNRVDVKLLGADGHLAHVPSGAHVTFRFDGRGHPIEEAHFGQSDEPILTTDGFHKLRTSYDLWGRPIEIERFGSDAKPIVGRGGWSSERTRWDEHDRPLRRDLFGSDGKPLVGEEGFAAWQARYDRFGDRVEERFIGLDGSFAADRFGAAGHLARFDDYGRLLCRTDYNLAGEAIGGIGHGSDGSQFAWSGSADHIDVLGPDGKALRDPAIAQALRDRAVAHRARLAVEKARVEKPGLFRNAVGVLVVGVGPRAAAHNFKPGDILLELDGRRLERPLDVTALVGKSELCDLALIRAGEGEVWRVAPADLADLMLEPE